MRRSRLARSTLPKSSVELAEFLFERAAGKRRLTAAPILEEALSYLEPTNQPVPLEIEIRTSLGRQLTKDKPKEARKHFEAACDLVNTIAKADRAALEANPFLELAKYMSEFHTNKSSTKRVAREAAALAELRGAVSEQVAVSLLFAKIDDAGDKRQGHLDQARRVALASMDGQSIAQVIAAELQ